MEQRTNENASTSNKKPKADGFLNTTIYITAKDGKEYAFKGGIPMHNSKAAERGVLANPAILEDSDKVRVEVSVHVIADEPENVEF